MAKPPKLITDEIATAEKDIFRDYIGRTLNNPDKVLKSESGGKGIELYEELLRDSKVGSTLQTRRLAVTGKEWRVDPASDKRQDVKVAEYVTQVLKAINLDAYRRAALSGLVLGFKASEIIWDYSEGDIFISKIIPKASRRFVFDLQNNLRLLTLSNMVEGEELPDRKFQLFVNPSDNGSPYGDGLGRMLYWPVWFKKNAIKFWMIFADKFGSPTGVGKYPAGTHKDQQQTLLDAVEAIQQESAIVIPDTLSIELLEAARQGSVNTYETLCKFMDEQIAMVMLGHTGSSESTPGKLGSEDMAKEVREDYVKADADLLCEAENNQVVRWIVDYNFPNISRNGYPKVWIRTDPEEDLKALAERDKIILVDMGMGKRVPESYLSETYNIPLAKEGEATIDVPEPQPAFGNQLSAITPQGSASSPRQMQSEAVNMCSCGAHHNFAEEDAWVQKYLDALTPSLKKSKAEALTEIEAWLKAQSSPPTQDAFVAKIQSILGGAYSFDQALIADTVAEVYTAQKIAGVLSSFGGPDIRAMNFLSQVDSLYLSKWLQNPESVSLIKSFLSEHYLNNGAGLFGRTADESIQAFRDLFEQKLTGLEDYQIQRIVDTAVQRTRNWSNISQLNGAGIAEIVIVEPTKDCAFCAAMDGKVIQVSTAYNRMSEHMAMSPEEFEASLKARDNQPTLDNIESLVSAGALPPYHPHCHGRVIKRIKK